MSTTVYNRHVFNQVAAPSKYIGTNLLQTHLLFECLAKSEESIIISEVCVAARVGMPVGFDMVKVLVVNWKNVLYGTCLRCCYNRKVIYYIYNQHIKNNLSAIIRDAHINESSYGYVFRMIFRSTWMFPAAWLFLYPYSLLPKRILRYLSYIKRALR